MDKLKNLKDKSTEEQERLEDFLGDHLVLDPEGAIEDGIMDCKELIKDYNKLRYIIQALFRGGDIDPKRFKQASELIEMVSDNQ